MKRHTLTILTSLLLLAGSASSAYAIGASECNVNADCGTNLICIASTNDCTQNACPEGVECPPPVCETSTSKTCQLAPPASCETTADCGSGLVCMTHSRTECSADGTATPVPICEVGDTTCDTNLEPPEQTEPTEGECETISQSFCVPPYIAPCTTDASCGAPGFTCEAKAGDCTCSSGGSTDGSAPDEPTCECDEPDENNRHCELAVLPCTANSDCSNGFSCFQPDSQPSGGSCSYNASTGEEECEIPETDPTETPTPGRCAPADYPYWMDGTKGSTGGNDEYTADAGINTGGSSNENAGSNAPGQNNADDNSGKGSESDDNGCHIASLNTGKTSTTAILLAGAAAFFTFSRRRKR